MINIFQPLEFNKSHIEQDCVDQYNEDLNNNKIIIASIFLGDNVGRHFLSIPDKSAVSGNLC